MNISVESDIGRRSAQEDMVLHYQDNHGALLAVADGVNGSKTATIIKEQLASIFVGYRTRVGAGMAMTPTYNALHELTKNETSGSTLTMAWIPKARTCAIIAVVGDSPAMVVDGKTEALWIAPEHNIETNSAEKQAALQRNALIVGGCLCVSRGGPFIQLSRAFGLRELDPILNRKPEIKVASLGKHSTLLIGSDGLFDPTHARTQKEALRIATMVRNGADAKTLIQNAFQNQSTDNISAIVCRP